MKKIFFFLFVNFIVIAAFSQYIHKIKADSVLITNDSCDAELNLENSTRSIKGFLYNYGNGRTKFVKALTKIDSVTFIIGVDTLNFATLGNGVSGWLLTGNTGINPEANFLGTTDSTDLIIKTKGVQNAVFNAAGGLTFKNGLGLNKIDLNKNGTGYLEINHRLGQGENNYFQPGINVNISMDSAHKKGRGNGIVSSRIFNSVNGLTTNPSSVDGSSILGHMELKMKKGNYSFFTDSHSGYPTGAILGSMHIASLLGGDSTARYNFYGNHVGVTTGLTIFGARMDFGWPNASDNYGIYNSYLSTPIFSGSAGRYTERFNHFAAASTVKGSSGKIGTITGVLIESLNTDSVSRAWGILQLGSNDINSFKGKTLIGDSTISNSEGNILYVSGTTKITDTLTIITLGVTDSSNRAASTKWVKLQNASAETLSNKRLTPRVGSTASSSTPTPDGDLHDQYHVTALAANAAFGAPSGTPVNGQVLLMRIRDNGTARTLSWNSIYRASADFSLPLTTVLSKTMYLHFIYNSTDSKWDCMGYTNGF